MEKLKISTSKLENRIEKKLSLKLFQQNNFLTVEIIICSNPWLFRSMYKTVKFVTKYNYLLKISTIDYKKMNCF